MSRGNPCRLHYPRLTICISFNLFRHLKKLLRIVGPAYCGKRSSNRGTKRKPLYCGRSSGIECLVMLLQASRRPFHKRMALVNPRFHGPRRATNVATKYSGCINDLRCSLYLLREHQNEPRQKGAYVMRLADAARFRDMWRRPIREHQGR